MRRPASMGCVAGFLMLAACNSAPAEVLPSGCYYDIYYDRPVLKVNGKHARILLKSDIRDVELVWTNQHVIVAKPAILLIEEPDGYRIERNDAVREINLPISNRHPMTFGVPDAPDGYMELKLGKPCHG